MPLPPILTFALRRILQAIPVILLIMIGSFLLIKLAPVTRLTHWWVIWEGLTRNLLQVCVPTMVLTSLYGFNFGFT